MRTTNAIWVVLGVVAVDPASAQEIFLQGGTLGVGLGAAMSINSAFGVHADFSAINFSHNFTVGGNLYDDDVRLRQGGIYGDFFPWATSGFRLTAGARFTDDHVTGTSVPSNGTYQFKGTVYPAYPGEYATAQVSYPTVMPYLGVGYGHQPGAKGFGFLADLGVAYGIPKVTYTLSPVLNQLAGPTMSQEIASTGLQELRHKASPYRWYPTLQVGVTYHF
jgi:hypothetical protein